MKWLLLMAGLMSGSVYACDWNYWPEGCSVWEGGECADRYNVECSDTLSAADQHARRKLKEERKHNPEYACLKYSLAAKNFLQELGVDAEIETGMLHTQKHAWVRVADKCLDINEGIVDCDGLHRLLTAN